MIWGRETWPAVRQAIVRGVKTQRFRGAEANMIVLRNELAADPIIGQFASFDLRPVRDDPSKESLTYGPIVELTIMLATSHLASGTYAGLKAAVQRARDRGHVEDNSDPDDGDDDAGTPNT
jgi:hypothetical protein